MHNRLWDRFRFMRVRDLDLNSSSTLYWLVDLIKQVLKLSDLF